MGRGRVGSERGVIRASVPELNLTQSPVEKAGNLDGARPGEGVPVAEDTPRVWPGWEPWAQTVGLRGVWVGVEPGVGTSRDWWGRKNPARSSKERVSGK